MNIDEQVAEFHRVMGSVDRATPGIPDEETVRLRIRLVLEEAIEFVEACCIKAGSPGSLTQTHFDIAALYRIAKQIATYGAIDPDLPGVADALADLDYVVAGSRLAFGIPQQPVADEVHRSNMAKAPGGVVKRDAGGKVQKPDDWTPPDVAGVLRAHGWEP